MDRALHMAGTVGISRGPDAAMQDPALVRLMGKICQARTMACDLCGRIEKKRAYAFGPTPVDPANGKIMAARSGIVGEIEDSVEALVSTLSMAMSEMMELEKL